MATDVTYECLLGIDFLGNYNTTIDPYGKSIKTDKGVVGPKGKNELPKVFRISLAETVLVPGRHDMILPPKFKGCVYGDGVLGIVEPSPGFAEKLDFLLVGMAAHPKGNMMPVRHQLQ